MTWLKIITLSALGNIWITPEREKIFILIQAGCYFVRPFAEIAIPFFLEQQWTWNFLFFSKIYLKIPWKYFFFCRKTCLDPLHEGWFYYFGVFRHHPNSYTDVNRIRNLWIFNIPLTIITPKYISLTKNKLQYRKIPSYARLEKWNPEKKIFLENCNFQQNVGRRYHFPVTHFVINEDYQRQILHLRGSGFIQAFDFEGEIELPLANITTKVAHLG